MNLETPAARLAIAKRVARDAYAWPGGYPLALVMSDGECLCPSCIKSEWRNIVDSTIRDIPDGWRAAGALCTADTDDAIACAHCGADLSAYPAD